MSNPMERTESRSDPSNACNNSLNLCDLTQPKRSVEKVSHSLNDSRTAESNNQSEQTADRPFKPNDKESFNRYFEQLQEKAKQSGGQMKVELVQGQMPYIITSFGGGERESYIEGKSRVDYFDGSGYEGDRLDLRETGSDYNYVERGWGTDGRYLYEMYQTGEKRRATINFADGRTLAQTGNLFNGDTDALLMGKDYPHKPIRVYGPDEHPGPNYTDTPMDWAEFAMQLCGIDHTGKTGLGPRYNQWYRRR